MIPFRNKFERAREYQRKQLGLDGPEGEKKDSWEQERPKLERGDRFAMILSAGLTLFLPAVLILLLLGGLVLLLFGVL